MTRFHLHIRDGDEFIEDPDGSDLPDLDAARAEAVQGAREILAQKVKAGEVVDGQRIEITDDAGTLLATVPFKDAIRAADA